MNARQPIATPIATTTHTLIDVDTTPQPLPLPVGAALFAATGAVWLTQDGRRDDVMLAHGARYDVRTRGLVVVSAIDPHGRHGAADHATLYVAAPADARAIGATDLRDFLRERAARMRDEEIDRVGIALIDGLRSLITGSLARWRQRRVDNATRGALTRLGA
jgi:hypothetical protein